MKRAGAALVSNGRRRAYTTWLEVAGERAWRLRLLHRVAAALANRRLRRGYVTWLDSLEVVHRATACLGAALDEWRGGAFRKGWFTWHAQYAARRRMLGCIASIRQSGKRQGFNTWHGAVETREKWKRRVKHALGLALNMTARQARRDLREWRDLTVARRLRLRAEGIYRDGARRRRAKAGFKEWAFNAMRLGTLRREEARRAAERAERLAQLAAEEKAAAERAEAEAAAAAEREAAEAKAAAEKEAAEKAAAEKAAAEKVAAEKEAADKAAAEANMEIIPRAPSPPPMPAYPVVRQRPRPRPPPPLSQGIVHVVHHHRGLPASASAPRLPRRSSPARRRSSAGVEPSRLGSWSTAASRAKARVGPMVPLDLGAAYFHQLEESQMLAAVRWRGEYDGVPHSLARALESADAFNHLFDPPLEWSDRVRTAAASASPGGRASASPTGRGFDSDVMPTHSEAARDDLEVVDMYYDEHDERDAYAPPSSAVRYPATPGPPSSGRRFREPAQAYNQYQYTPQEAVDPLDERARPYYYHGEKKSSPEGWGGHQHPVAPMVTPGPSHHGPAIVHVHHHGGRVPPDVVAGGDARDVTDRHLYEAPVEATGASGGAGSAAPALASWSGEHYVPMPVPSAHSAHSERHRAYPRQYQQQELPPPQYPKQQHHATPQPRTPPLTRPDVFGPPSGIAGPSPMPAWSARRPDMAE